MISPIKGIYDINIENHELVEQSNLIEKLVIFGTNLLSWELESKEKSGKFALIFLLRRTLEILDSISILIKNSTSSTLMILIRSQIECFFYIEFILRENTKQRGISYTYWHLKDFKKIYEKLSPGYEQSKQIQGIFSEDTSGNIELDSPPLNLQDILNDINFRLNNEIYSEIKEEEKRLRSLKIKTPKWYQYYNQDINSIEKLASSLGCGALYEVNYRLTSRSTHGNDSHEGYFDYNADKTINLYNIRTPVMSLDCTIESSHFALKLYQSYIEKRLPECSDFFNNWFNDEIQELREMILDKKEKGNL